MEEQNLSSLLLVSEVHHQSKAMPARLREDQGNCSQLTMVDLQVSQESRSHPECPDPASPQQHWPTSSPKAMTRALIKLALSGILQINHLGKKKLQNRALRLLDSNDGVNLYRLVYQS